jgi:carbonic anhydrase/acetyltransferase-like protein (isoleucine patch superfamily)
MPIETGTNASILTYNGITPTIHKTVFLTEGVRIIGDVEIGEDSSVWYNSVIRGDVNFIRIGKRTNIQDLSMLHVTYNKYPLVVGDNVTVGHSAVLHGTTIGNCVLIGMGARVLDRSNIGDYSLVAAGAVVREGFVVPEGTLVAGVPAKIIRELTNEERTRLEESAANYIRYAAEYKRQMP